MGHKLLILAGAGALGTVSRVGLSALLQRVLGLGFPWGTVGVNLLGCFLFGLVWAVFESRLKGVPDVRWFLLAGFMGAFTTFSTYVFEVVALLEKSRWLAAGANLALQNGVGIVALMAGIAIGRSL
jgi:CrcB protein